MNDGRIIERALGGGSLSTGSITSSALTETRVVYAGAAGLLSDSSGLTFSASGLRVGTMATAAYGSFAQIIAGNNTDDSVVRLRHTGSAGNISTTFDTTGAFYPMRFLTSDTTRWEIGTAGHLITGADNTYDIGASGATRPRNVYVGSAGVFGGTISAGSAIMGSGHINAGANSQIYWASKSSTQSPSDGVIEMTNNAASDFNRLQFGGTTSSFPAIKRNSAALNFRLADDSADAAITAAAITASGVIKSTSGYQSSDGTAGATAGPFTVITSITVKNGLVTALTGS